MMKFLEIAVGILCIYLGREAIKRRFVKTQYGDAKGKYAVKAGWITIFVGVCLLFYSIFNLRLDCKGDSCELKVLNYNFELPNK